MAKNKKKITESEQSKNIRFIVILILAVVVVLALYFRLTNNSKNSNQQAEENMTEIEVLKMYDMEAQYPKAARDVVKMHCRILKTLYNEELEEDEYAILNDQVRCLFSNELLEANAESEQYADLMNDIEAFHETGKMYISYTVDAEELVQYSKVEGIEYAMVIVNCSIKENTVTNPVKVQYLLAKENGKWKIVGWQEIIANDNTAE